VKDNTHNQVGLSRYRVIFAAVVSGASVTWATAKAMGIAIGRVSQYAVEKAKIASPAPIHDVFVCPVFFLDLVASSKKSIAEQALAKQRLNAAILTATSDIAPTDRLILDVGDGVAVSFFCDARCALRVGLELSSSLGDPGSSDSAIEARVGINLGPVRLVQDVNGHTNIIGDGINAAQRVMSFADPGQVLVSRSYHNLLVAISEQYARLFAYQGVRVDKHSREHEIYEVVATGDDLQKAGPRTALLVPSAGATSRRGSIKKSWIPFVDARRWIGMRRPGYAAMLLFAFLGAAVGVHWAGGRDDRSWSATTIRSEATPVNIAPLASSRPSSHDVEVSTSPTPSRPVAQRATARPRFVVAGIRMKDTYTERTVSRQRMASVHLAISPWGEVLVDGKTVGISPPLSRLELAPGAHRVEIKNRELYPYLQTVRLQPSQTLKLKHKFSEEWGRSASRPWSTPVIPPG